MDKYILLGYVRDSAIKVLVHIIINTFLGANECASDNYIVQQVEVKNSYIYIAYQAKRKSYFTPGKRFHAMKS